MCYISFHIFSSDLCYKKECLYEMRHKQLQFKERINESRLSDFYSVLHFNGHPADKRENKNI